MDETVKKSILEMARGGFLEQVDYEMAKVIDNILDPQHQGNWQAPDHRHHGTHTG